LGKKTFILLLILFIFSGFCYLEASGFRNFELSARAATLGGAFVARVDDASAVFYNPAGLAFLTGFRLKTNIHYLEITSTAEYPGSPESFKSTPHQIRLSNSISLNIKDRIGFGIGGFTPNTMDTKWPESWVGNELSINSKVNTFYIRPVVAVKISNHLALGAGIDFIFANVAWEYNRIFTFQESGSGYYLAVSSESDVSGKGIGFVTGILIRISDNLRIGGRYQPNVKLDLEGLHSFRIPFGYNPDFFIDQEVTSTLTVPQEFVLGFMYSPVKSLSLQLDLQWIGMSKIKQWEFYLNPQFYEEYDDYYGTKPDYARQGIDLNLRNTSRIMFGIDYHFRNLISLRAGYTYQKSSADSQMLHPVFPDLDTNILSFGIGYEGPLFSTYRNDEIIGGFSIDGYFQYGFSPSRTSALTEFPAAYRASRWIAGVGLGFNF